MILADPAESRRKIEFAGDLESRRRLVAKCGALFSRYKLIFTTRGRRNTKFGMNTLCVLERRFVKNYWNISSSLDVFLQGQVRAVIFSLAESKASNLPCFLKLRRFFCSQCVFLVPSLLLSGKPPKILAFRCSFGTRKIKYRNYYLLLPVLKSNALSAEKEAYPFDMISINLLAHLRPSCMSSNTYCKVTSFRLGFIFVLFVLLKKYEI